MRQVRTHYDNLKVPRDATPTVIRAAYRRLSMQHHPDRNPGDTEAARVMALINVAYRVLSDPDKRAAHDHWIARQEAVAEPWQTPAGNTPPPPWPVRPQRTQRPRKPPLDRSDMPESLRQIARGAVFYLLTMLIFSPFLMSMAKWWNTREPQPAPVQAVHKPKLERIYKPDPTLNLPIDLSGVYRLIQADHHSHGGKRSEISKGKLVLRKLSDGRYVVLEAKTVRGSGTLSHASVYSPARDHEGRGRVILARYGNDWIAWDGALLTRQILGANFKETTKWWYEPQGFSEKYLDRGIVEAERIYRVRVERGLEVE